MKGDVEINYRGMTIKHSDLNGKEDFSVDGDKTYPTLFKACERIDELVKIHIDKTPVFYEIGYNSSLRKAIATSVNEAGEVYVTYPEKKGGWGSRGRVGTETKVFVDCPENWEKYAQILEIRKELKGIVAQYQDKSDEITVTMQRIGGKVE